MKHVLLNELKKEEKVFKKSKKKGTIKKNYNPFEVNYKIYKRGSGLYMKGNILKEIRKKLDWKGKIISYIFPRTFIRVYGIATQRVVNNILI